MPLHVTPSPRLRPGSDTITLYEHLPARNDVVKSARSDEIAGGDTSDGAARDAARRLAAPAGRRNWTSVYAKHSGSMKITTHMVQVGRLEGLTEYLSQILTAIQSQVEIQVMALRVTPRAASPPPPGAERPQSYRKRGSISNFLVMKFTTQHDLYQ